MRGKPDVTIPEEARKQRAADLDGVCYRAEFPYWSQQQREQSGT